MDDERKTDKHAINNHNHKHITLRGDFTTNSISTCISTRDSGACSEVRSAGPQASSALSAVHAVGPGAFENSDSVNVASIYFERRK